MEKDKDDSKESSLSSIDMSLEMEEPLFDMKNGILNAAPTLFSAMVPILRLGLPTIINFFFVRIADITMLHFLGKLGNASYTASAGIGNVWVLMVMGSPVFGFVSAIDTLVSQSFGKKEYEMCGIYYNRGCVFSLIMSIALAPLALLSGTFLKLVGRSEEDAVNTREFSTVLILHMILWLQYVAGQKFLNSQKIVIPQLAIMVICSSLHPFWVYAFIHWLGWGFIGAAYARCFTSTLALIGLICYIRLSGKCAATIVPHSVESVRGLGSYLKLGFPSAAMNCLGAWAYQIVYLMSGFFGTKQLAANVALVNINMLSSTIHNGMATSIAALVGNSIGARKTQNAKIYIWSSLLLTVMLCGVYNILLLSFRTWIAEYFSEDEEVIENIRSLILVMNIELIFDNTQGLLRGVLLGMGRQRMATYANIVSFYAIMLPAAYIFAFVCGFGVKGIWIAMSVGYGSVAVSYMCIILREDWALLEIEAKQRIEKDKNRVRG